MSFELSSSHFLLLCYWKKGLDGGGSLFGVREVGLGLRVGFGEERTLNFWVMSARPMGNNWQHGKRQSGRDIPAAKREMERRAIRRITGSG